MSPAVQPQLAALGHTPHITTYKAVGKSQPPTTPSPLSNPSPVILQKDNPPSMRPKSLHQAAPNLNNNISNNNINNNHYYEGYQQQQGGQRVPFTTLSNQPEQPSARPQTATAKAFNSAQAVFNQSVPSHQPIGSAHQGHPAPPTSLSTAPFSSSGQQNWANGREEGRRELGSIRNIKRLSGAPQQEDNDRYRRVDSI